MDSDEELAIQAPEEEGAFAVQPADARTGLRMTPEVRSQFDGQSSWFAYEDLIDDWLGITAFDPGKHGPSLKNALVGAASFYKSTLDNALLVLPDPDRGLPHFKDTLRPSSVKGRFEIAQKRPLASWSDLLDLSDLPEVGTDEFVAALSAAPQLEMQNLPAFQTVSRETTIANRKRDHMAVFPLSDNLVSLIFLVQAGLNEQQRERFVSSMTIPPIAMPQYTYLQVKQLFLELFCVSRTGVADPNIAHRKRHTFYIIEEAETEDGEQGFWVVDEETEEEGFTGLYTEAEFWVLGAKGSYSKRRLTGRTVKKEGPTGYGKKRKGSRPGFRPRSTAHSIPAAVGILGKTRATTAASAANFYSLARTFRPLAIRGFGLVDVAGKSVTSRSDAVGCGLCTPGTSSSALMDDIGRTYTCKSCEPGSYQELSGETLCISCPVGRIAGQAGLSQCEACPPGSFANSVGLEICQICGAGSLWTTSRKVELHGSEQWIQVEAAVSEDYCHCIPGYFLEDQTCRECSEGASCPGSNQVELLPGYFSFSTDPGSIYRCYPKALACPGGASHAFLLYTNDDKLQVGFVKAGIYVGQLAVSVQVIVVIQRMDVEWQVNQLQFGGGPNQVSKSLGPKDERAFSFVSFDRFLQSLNAVSCVTRFSPTWKFLFQTVAVPTAFMAGPVLVHISQICRSRTAKGSWKLHVLGETFGLFCMLFFIVLCTAVLEPFDCVSHPNEASTMRTSAEVLCNFRNDHLSLSLVASFLTLLPLAFLSLCAWLVVKELPKRIHGMDVKFIRSCSFLISRFRPGSETFSIFLLVRNAILAIAPVLPSPEAGCLLVFAVLGTNLCLTAMFQPWLSSLATYLDVLTNFGFLLILLNGAFFLETSNDRSGMIVCSLVLCCILLVLSSLSIFTLQNIGSESGESVMISS
eukprot:s1825_g19.t1